MAATSSFIEVLQNPGEVCADCGDAPATHRLQSNSDGVETRAVLCKSCLDRRFSQLGVSVPFARGTCEYCGSPDGMYNTDPLLEMAGLKAPPRFACSRCEMVRLRFRVEALRTLQGEGGPSAGFYGKFPNVLHEAESRAREYVRAHPLKANPRVFTIASMCGMAEMIARPHELCDTCGTEVATCRVWSQMEEQETEARLCERCLPEKSAFMALDFVPEDAVCCFCGGPASFPVQDPGKALENSPAEEFECVRCSRLFGRYLSEIWTPERKRNMRREGLEEFADAHREARQKVRDHFRDHPE